MENDRPERSVWQLASGPTDRSYADVFLRYGVGMIGPGDPGPWKPERYVGFKGFVERFATQVKAGDVLVLRTGMKTICAIGIVASEYMYLNQFDDVNGWDLQHARRVRWFRLPKEHEFGSPVFGANPTRWSRVKNAEVRELAQKFVNSPPTRWQTASLPELPQEEPPLTEIPDGLHAIIAEANDLASLYTDEQAFGQCPAEDELVAHFIVPLLRALGWPVEYIAVKWENIDVAVFKALPRLPNNCHFIVEAKRLGSGVEGALDQAKEYLKNIGVQRDVVLTDGIRYRMYSCAGQFACVAYANLVRLKESARQLFSMMRRP